MSRLLRSLKIIKAVRHLYSSESVHLQRISSRNTLHRSLLSSFLLHLHLHENLIHHVLVMRTSLPHSWILLLGPSIVLLFLNLSRHYLLKLRLGHLTPLNCFLMPLNLLRRHLWLLVSTPFAFLVFVLILTWLHRLIWFSGFFDGALQVVVLLLELTKLHLKFLDYVFKRLVFAVFLNNLLATRLIQKRDYSFEELETFTKVLWRIVESGIDVIEYFLSWKSWLPTLDQSFRQII